MFIIWGTKSREERLGAVADWCNACRALRPFSVTNYFQVGHIYYISLGSGTLVASARRCWCCRSQFYCDHDHYDEFLPRDTVQQLSMDQFLRRTNGRLKRYLDAERQDLLPARHQGNEPQILDALPVNDHASN